MFLLLVNMAKTTKITLEDLNNNMNKRFDVIDEKFKSIKNEILIDMKEMLKPTKIKVREVQKSVTKLQKDVNNKISYLYRQTELVITGIPCKKNENLQKLFVSIASILGYSSGSSSPDFSLPDVDIFRVPGENPEKRRIIVKFASVVVKERFLHRSFGVAKKMLLSSIGMKSSERFYIQQNLAPEVQKWKLAALQAKKKKLILKVKIVNGDIFIQCKDDTRLKLVKSMSDIPVLEEEKAEEVQKNVIEDSDADEDSNTEEGDTSVDE